MMNETNTMMNRANAPGSALRRAMCLIGGLGLGLVAGCPARPVTSAPGTPGTPGTGNQSEPACLHKLRRLQGVSLADTTRPKGGNGGCTEDDCGTNSAFMNGYHIDELQVLPFTNTGAANHDGVKIIAFIPPPTAPGPAPYFLSADNGELVAQTASTAPGGVELRGDALVGGKIIVELPATPLGEIPALPAREDVIVIQRYDPASMWIEGATVDVPRYLLTYAPADHGFTKTDDPRCFQEPICQVAAQVDDDVFAWASVVSGERYQHDGATDLPQPEIAGTQLQGWFNLACQGNALFKAKVLGYDPAPTVEAMAILPQAGWAKAPERQATLKMVTADYCGNNTSFTENGTAVRWINRDGTVDNQWLLGDACPLPAAPDDAQIEAIWSAKGALCLRGNGPLRRDEHDRAEVNSTCGAVLPSCQGFQPPSDWVWKTYVCPAP